MRWVLVALFTTAAAFAAGQNASLPEGDGKAIVTAACAGCHALDLITVKQATKDEWAGVVDRMKTYGTTLTGEQTTTVVDYLAKSFPPKGAAPAAAAAGQSSASDNEAKAMIAGVCASCHAADLTTSKKADKTEWAGIVERMKTYGATMTDAQTTLLVDYLARVHGTGPAPAPAAASAAAAKEDPGKVAMDAYCGGCHDLDLVTARKATKAEWQDIVDRMNARGAGVPEKDIAPMVEFLAKTYK
jgi:cytochrome c553